jgi:hypothetical protein
MDNPFKRQSNRVNEPALRPAAPGRDVLLALATAWSSSHGYSSAAPAAVTPSAAPRTIGAAGAGCRTAATTGRTSR